MELKFGIDQYMMSRRLANYPNLGKLISKTMGTLNVGQYARAEIFKNIIKELPLDNINTILDLGCGQGEYTMMLARAFADKQITALDIEENRISKIYKMSERNGLTNIIPYPGSLDSLQVDEYYDFIYSIDVFEHIAPNQMPFKEVYKKLKSGGLFFVKMPNVTQSNVFPEALFNDHKKWLEDEHIGQVYNLKDLESRLENEGFQVIKSFYGDGIISRLAWEMWFFAKKIRPEFQLLITPLLKLLVNIDRLIPNKNSGNTIQVLAKKI